jgi:hypothetical protein
MVTVVEIPTIAIPAATPFYSNSDTLTISGMCMSGFTVTLSGDGNETQTCANSTYSFSVLKAIDGLYSFQITQSGETGTTSAGAPLVWVKKTSVAPPTITSPTTTPFSSAQATLSVVGGCETGATVALSGDAAGSTTCVSSLFAFSIPKIADGDYSFVLTQTDRAGNSAASNLEWRKYGISVSPNNPSLVVATQQVFTLSGGLGRIRRFSHHKQFWRDLRFRDTHLYNRDSRCGHRHTSSHRLSWRNSNCFHFHGRWCRRSFHFSGRKWRRSSETRRASLGRNAFRQSCRSI